ncbi:MAG TPA: tyrosinase family protein [Steroidobacteraceae bacterium]|nr:tyrosinase family protein [Steroidobacteraceae bacterium]
MSSGRTPLSQSRRNFLQRAALGTGIAGLLGGSALLAPSRAFAVCEPPGAPGTAKPWRSDCRPIRPRRPASTLSAAEITKLKDAYQAMRALSTSDPNDPRGFTQQANVHCWYCGAGTQVHFSWQFFAWHRAELYFHERILGKLVNDPEFRLPYWDWDVATHRRLPGAYVTPNDNTNPLWNGTRAMSPTDELPEEDVGSDVMEAALTAGTFADFGGTATDSGIPELSPHGSVHTDVGGFTGDMSAFSTAGRDPIFYAHHSNIDKMWSDWIKGGSSHLNPTDPAFLDLTWNFYDENKVWRSIKASQVLNHEAQLRYVYGPSRFSEMLPCIFQWVVVRVPWTFDRAVLLDPKVRTQLARAVERKLPLRLHIDAPQIPLDKTTTYRVYADPKEAQADAGPKSPSYLGTIPIVLNDRDGHNPLKRPPRVVFNVTRRSSYLLSADRPLQLAYVERAAKGQQKRLQMQPLKARVVYFSYGEQAGD